MDQQIINDVLSMWLGSDYPGIEDMASDVACSLREGAPVVDRATIAAHQ